jgi:hypothetical protein
MQFVVIPTRHNQYGDAGRPMAADTLEQVEDVKRVMEEDGLLELRVYSSSSDDLDDVQDVVETRLRIVTGDDDGNEDEQ